MGDDFSFPMRAARDVADAGKVEFDPDNPPEWLTSLRAFEQAARDAGLLAEKEEVVVRSRKSLASEYGKRATRFIQARQLDGLVNFAQRQEKWEAYHFIRAWAHESGVHLSTCTGGLRLEDDAFVGRDEAGPE